MATGRFLGGIAGLVWSPEQARYLLLQRVATKDFAAGAWECVTGRVEQGEGFEHALRREVREELGVEVDIDFILGTTHFYRGDPAPANELIGVVYHCSLLSPRAMVLNWEHGAARWVTYSEAQSLLRPEDPSEAWLLRVLARAERLRPEMPASVVGLARTEGLELG